MTQNVTVKYILSPTGQRAAFVAGRPASKVVTEQLQLDSTVADALSFDSAGRAFCDCSERYAPAQPLTGKVEGLVCDKQYMVLDAPPEGLADLVRLWRQHAERLDVLIAEARRQVAAADEERKTRRERDEKIADELYAQVSAVDLLAPLPDTVKIISTGLAEPDLLLSYESNARFTKLYYARKQALIDQAEAKRQQAAAEQLAKLEAIVAEHGGFRWTIEGAMCDFRGYGLWQPGQERRWVGIFNSPRGIAKFLTSPRGEQTWDVADLQPGDCIQGAGFSESSRGRRRNESEFFGVVVRITESELVVRAVESRTAALKLRGQHK